MQYASMLELNMQAFCCPPNGQPNDQRVGRPGSCTVARRAARVTTCGCWGANTCCSSSRPHMGQIAEIGHSFAAAVQRMSMGHIKSTGGG